MSPVMTLFDIIPFDKLENYLKQILICVILFLEKDATDRRLAH